MIPAWTTDALYRELAASELPAAGVTLELAAGEQATISATMREHGDLVIQLAASGEQIFVSAPLCRGSQVKDRNRFNEAFQQRMRCTGFRPHLRHENSSDEERMIRALHHINPPPHPGHSPENPLG